jgi:hypothetical protein
MALSDLLASLSAAWSVMLTRLFSTTSFKILHVAQEG